MKIKRRGPLVRVDIDSAESGILIDLLDDFGAMLDAADPGDAVTARNPVIQRLFPDGYRDDEDAAQEYRDLVVEDLRAARHARLQVCRAEIPAAGGRVELDLEGADRWIRVLNDLRLAFGVQLGVSEETELDPADDLAQIYGWLTAVQDTFVTQLMR